MWMCQVGPPTSRRKVQINKSSRKTHLVITALFETWGGGEMNACKIEMNGINEEQPSTKSLLFLFFFLGMMLKSLPSRGV